jgi:hypothetical protein
MSQYLTPHKTKTKLEKLPNSKLMKDHNYTTSYQSN